MAAETLDRRVRKTRKLLRHCLAVLLKEKRIQDITVREITEMADLNRGTFYLHYKDVFDLLEQVERELLEEFNEALEKFHTAEIAKKPSLVFVEIFQCVQDNADMVQILIGENGDMNFVNRVQEIVREKCLKDWMDNLQNQDSTLFDAYYAFIVNGYIGLVTYWLKSGMKETPAEMAQIAEQIVLKGIHILDQPLALSSGHLL